jgi:hypothetical protein
MYDVIYEAESALSSINKQHLQLKKLSHEHETPIPMNCRVIFTQYRVIYYLK